MAEIEIGIYKSGRQAYGFDDIAIVPSRRTRDPEDVDISWEIDAFRFDLPLMAAAMDGVVSPPDRHRDRPARRPRRPQPRGAVDPLRGPRAPRSRRSPSSTTTRPPPGCSRSTSSRSSPSSSPSASARSRTRASSPAASLTPQRTARYAPAILAGELDLLVIQGTVVSAEHVSKTVEPLNLKRFIREFDIPVIVGGCASYQAALHLMRTGAVGVLVGVGPGQRLHHPRRARHRRAPGHRHRRRGRGPDAPPRRDRRLRPRHRRRGHEPGRRHRQGHRLRGRRGHARLAAVARPRRPRPRLPLGHGHLPSRPCPAGRGSAPRCAARSRRSSSARPTRTTAA